MRRNTQHGILYMKYMSTYKYYPTWLFKGWWEVGEHFQNPILRYSLLPKLVSYWWANCPIKWCFGCRTQLELPARKHSNESERNSHGRFASTSRALPHLVLWPNRHHPLSSLARLWPNHFLIVYSKVYSCICYLLFNADCRRQLNFYLITYMLRSVQIHIDSDVKRFGKPASA